MDKIMLYSKVENYFQKVLTLISKKLTIVIKKYKLNIKYMEVLQMISSAMHIDQVEKVEFRGVRLEACKANSFNIEAPTGKGTASVAIFASYEQLRDMRDALNTYLEEQGQVNKPLRDRVDSSEPKVDKVTASQVDEQRTVEEVSEEAVPEFPCEFTPHFRNIYDNIEVPF